MQFQKVGKDYLINIDKDEKVLETLTRFCKENGINFPLEGVVRGHHKKDEEGTMKIVNQLSKGVPLIVKNEIS